MTTVKFTLPKIFVRCIDRMSPLLKTISSHDGMLGNVRLELGDTFVSVVSTNGHMMTWERFRLDEPIPLWEDTRPDAQHIVHIPIEPAQAVAKAFKNTNTSIEVTMDIPPIEGNYDVDAQMQLAAMGQTHTIIVKLPAYPADFRLIYDKGDPNFIREQALQGDGFISPAVSVPSLAVVAAFMANDVAPTAKERKHTLDVLRYCAGNESPDVYRTMPTKHNGYTTPDRMVLVMPMKMPQLEDALAE